METEILCAKKDRKKHKSKFLTSLYSILEGEKYRNLINWAKDGTCFEVIRQREFSEVVLPKYFRHDKFSSFTRQLNMYNFNRFQGETGFLSFSHPCFLKGQRRKVQIKPVSMSQQRPAHEDDEEDSYQAQDDRDPFDYISKQIKLTEDSQIRREFSFENTREFVQESMHHERSGNRMFLELERQSNRAATRTDQEPTLSDYLKETLELCYKYETEGVYPEGFALFKRGLEIFLNFEEIERRCESEYNIGLDLKQLTSIHSEFKPY